MRFKTYRAMQIILIAMLALLASSVALGQRPPAGGPPDRGFPGDGRRGGPPDGRPPRADMQGPPDGQHPQPPPPFGPQADWLSSEMRFGDRLVKGLPYSAEFTTETIQMLGDGTRITRKSNGSLARSSEGRTRREQTLGAIGPIAVEGEPPHIVFINDPIAGAHYVLDLNSRVARRLPFRENPSAPPLPSDFEHKADPLKNESLGRKSIEGIDAEGTRSTITIPAGRVGNDRPLEIVSERWFSPELQIVVLSKHKDPFAGETVYRLSNISHAEPDQKLFEVPAGYAIEEGRPEDGPRRPRPPRPDQN